MSSIWVAGEGSLYFNLTHMQRVWSASGAIILRVGGKSPWPVLHAIQDFIHLSDILLQPTCPPLFFFTSQVPVIPVFFHKYVHWSF